VAPQHGQLIGEKGHVEERHHGLRARVGQGPEPRALPTGQDDRAQVPGVQGWASLISITGMPSRMG